MQVYTRPRIITISVPLNVKPDHIGDYVTERAHEILAQGLIAASVPGSLTIEPLNERLFILSVRTNGGEAYKIPNTVNVFESEAAGAQAQKAVQPEVSNARTDTQVEAAKPLPVRPQGGPRKAVKD